MALFQLNNDTNGALAFQGTSYNAGARVNALDLLDSDILSLRQLGWTVLNAATGQPAKTGAGGAGAPGVQYLTTAYIGNSPGTVAAGDDARIVGAAQKAANGSDFANPKAVRSNLGLEKYTRPGDANYTILPTDRTVAATVTFTAARTWTLPPANSVNEGGSLRIVDSIGTVDSTKTLTIVAAGSDTLNGAASSVFAAAYTDFQLVSDGASRWNYDVQGITRGGTGATTAAGARANLGLPLDGQGKLLASLLPALAISEVFPVASQAAMLALTAQRGDVALRSDVGYAFILATDNPGTLADWKQWPLPTGVIMQLAGLPGPTISAAQLKTALAITASDITDAGGFGNLMLKATSAATVTALLSLFTADSGGFPGKQGLVPSPAVGDAAAGKFLAADATWKTVALAPQTRFSRYLVVTSSKSVTLPAGVRGRITALGGSGSGGIARMPSGNAGNGAASGGANGGLSIKAFQSAVALTLNIMVGAGGTGIVYTGSSLFSSPGNAGGSTTVSGGDIVMFAGGGMGGNAATSSTGACTAAGATGGTASGGDLNYQGGGSGTATITDTNAQYSCAATGGGATPWFGTAYPSGNATASSGATVATGGAGVGGASGSVSRSGSGNSPTGGGSGSGPSDSSGNGGPDFWNAVSSNNPYQQSQMVPVFTGTLFMFTGRGGYGGNNNSGAFGDPGCGGGAGTTVSSSYAGSGAQGGLFAGGGASASQNYAVAGAGGFQLGGGTGGTATNIGGGGGAAVTGSYNGANPTASGNGGQGFVLIEYDVI